MRLKRPLLLFMVVQALGRPIRQVSFCVCLLSLCLMRSKNFCELLFLGDPNQLPPVEPGAPFSKCIEEEEKRYEPKGHPGKLLHCQRTELQDILKLSTLVCEGDSEGALSFLQNVQQGGPVQFRQV